MNPTTPSRSPSLRTDTRPSKNPTSHEMYGVSTCFPPSELDIRFSIDWIKVKVGLSQPSQFRHLRKRLANATGVPHSFIEPHADGGPSNSCTSFVLTMHDPESPDHLMAFLQGLVRADDPPILEGDVTVLGIEVSMDVRSRLHPGDLQWIDGMLKHLVLYRSYRADGISRLRSAPAADGPVGPRIIFSEAQLCRALAARATLHSGDKKSNSKQRMYAKTYNTVGSQQYADLAPEAWSARYEVTLCEDRVPFKSIKEWRDFSFTSLRADYFTWRLEPTERRDSWTRQVGVLPPIPRVIGGKKTRGRKHLIGTRVDVALGQAIKNALERFDRRQQGLYKRKASAKKSEQLSITEG